MMKIKKPESEEYLDIYSARLTFTKKKNGQVSKDMVRVVIRYKKRDPEKRDFQIPDKPNPNDPKDLYINTDELHWVRYRRKVIAVYHRVSKNDQDYDYVNSRRICVHTILRSGLENLVEKVCFEETGHIK